MRSWLSAALLVCLVLLGVPSGAFAADDVRFVSLKGTKAPGTPKNLNRVGILQVGSPKAKKVLVLNPGTSASAAYFVPLAETVAAMLPDWQVWAVERRENLLEDQSVLDQAKAGTVNGQQLFDYYLGFLADPSITPHFELIKDADVDFAHDWGMRVEIEDLHRVVKLARKHHGQVVVGGHSLGGSITTAYATWDFHRKAGAAKLRGLVFIDGGSNPVPITPENATAALATLRAGTPWLTFGGIPAPFAGLFNATGSAGCFLDPDQPSIGQASPLIPANLKPPIAVTNIAQYGYALDTETSPAALAAAQAHLGHLAASGDPRGWDQAGEITPILRYAQMFSGWGIPGHDGTAWYHPQRLTLDSAAVAAGNENPAQDVLDVRATHGHDLPQDLKIYAFGAALGGQAVLAAAGVLAQQSGIPEENLTLIDRHETYAHNDPNSAYPNNEFLDGLIPFLQSID